jgi:DNA-binding NarL/FixJ family response regulator
MDRNDAAFGRICATPPTTVGRMLVHANSSSAGSPSDPVALATLTPTQMRVLRGVRSGLLNKQIAYDLGIAEATVKAHMTALMRKLNVRNRTQVAIAAQALAGQPIPANA